MQVRTFTSFWNQDRKLYALNDVKLPAAISLRVLVVFILTAAPWWGILYLVHFPIQSPWYLIWLLPPVGLALAANRPIYQGKTLFEYLLSRASYIFLESKRYKGLDPETEEPKSLYLVEQAVFTRSDLARKDLLR